jgi:hypothetical protein
MAFMSITVNQQGDRLKTYRPSNRGDSFKPSPFSLILINVDTSEIVGSSREMTMSNFFHTLFI